MDKRSMPPWPQLSYVLAKEIIQKKLHIGYLTSNELEQFEAAAESFSRWYLFVTTAAVRDTDTTTTLGNQVLNSTIPLRVRSMLFEQFIPHLYRTDYPCCKDTLIDFDELCEKARALQLPEPDDLDREADKMRKTKDETVIEERHAEEIKEDGESLESNVEETSVSMPVTSHIENVPLRDVYHTVEHDHAAMVELQKLEEFEAEERLNDENEKEHTDDHSLSMLNTSGNFNLKYLLQGIAANRHQTSLTDRELRNLLSDFKPHRTKWANDDRVGQEELYEACEKVLNDLKNYTEHSTPFLNKVSKREAPDYFDVIKHPMDLGTVTKKMKQLQYKSKKEFADDLYLIYENCLIYNTNPASEYRKHAIAMKRKTDRLLARVPDITIRNRSEVEAEEFGDDLSDDADSDIQRLSRKAPGKHKHPAPVEGKENGDMNRTSRERSLTRESSVAPGASDTQHAGSDNESSKMTPNGHTPHTLYGGKQSKAGEGSIFDAEGKALDEEIDSELKELQDQVWLHMTKKTRAKAASDVEKQYQFPFADRRAITRSSLDMERFLLLERLHSKPAAMQKLIKCTSERFSRWIERNGAVAGYYDDIDLDSSDDENLDAFFSKRIVKPKAEEEDALRTDLFLPEYAITCGIPEIDDVQEEEVTLPESRPMSRKTSVDTTADESTGMQKAGYTDIPLDIYPSVHFPNHGLNAMIDRNLETLRKVRLVYAKCNAVRNNVPIPALASSIPLSEPPTYGASEDFSTRTEASVAPPPLIMDQESGVQLMQRTLVKLLAHAGFEGAHKSALDVFTELAMDYILNVGRTLRAYWDDYGRQMSKEEILLHVLYENGVLDISDLESYIRDDVERYGHRLDELHRKLETSYQDILSGSTVEKTEDEDALFQDEEAFITGYFGEELGEDYFGFKELGLDAEYNINAFSIPARLWFGGNKEKAQSTKAANKEPPPAYPPPPPFTPLRSEKEVIGLLQPYFAKKLSEAPNGHLIEDEYNPSKLKLKTRYPPSDRPRAGVEVRKTKRKRPLAEIEAERAERAEKKRLKLEEREKKLAEKEQKRKLREEMKEQERLAKLEAKERKAQAKKAAAAAAAAAAASSTSSSNTNTNNS